MARRKSKKKTGIVTLDLSSVEGRVLIESGDYAAKVIEVTEEEGEKAPYLKWKFEITEGEYEGKSPMPYVTSLSENSLWNLRGLLEALDVEIPDSEFDLELEDLADKELTITIEEDEYEGRKQSKVTDFAPAEEGSSKKKKKKGKKGKDRDEEEEEEEEEDEGKSKKKGKKDKKKKKLDRDEVGEMSQDELQELIDEHGLDVDLDDHKSLRKMKNAVIDALESEDLLED